MRWKCGIPPRGALGLSRARLAGEKPILHSPIHFPSDVCTAFRPSSHNRPRRHRHSTKLLSHTPWAQHMAKLRLFAIPPTRRAPNANNQHNPLTAGV